MTVTSQPSALPQCPRAVVFGSFDGVHVGHRALLKRATQSGLRTTAVTFNPHPRRLLGSGVSLISSARRRAELLTEAGAEDVLVTSFTHEIARMPPEHWVEEVLKQIGTKQVVVGDGFRFGYRRAGDAETLRNAGIDVLTHELLSGTSSTRVRELIVSGDLAAAERLLARPIELEGVLHVGCGNWFLLLDEDAIVPPRGRYTGRAPTPVEVTVCGSRRVELSSRTRMTAHPGERLCVPLDSSHAHFD